MINLDLRDIDYPRPDEGRLGKEKAREQAFIINEILEEDNRLGVLSALDENLPRIYGSDYFVEQEAERCIGPVLTLASKFAENDILEATRYLALAEKELNKYSKKAGLESEYYSAIRDVFTELAGGRDPEFSYSRVLSELESYRAEFSSRIETEGGKETFLRDFVDKSSENDEMDRLKAQAYW